MKFLFVSVVLLTVTNCSATPQPLFPTGDMFDMTINVPSGNRYKQQYLFFGDYNFYGVELDRKLHVYRNGAVSFGGEIDSGAPYIKGFFAETNTSTDFNVEFFLDNGHNDCKTDMFQVRKLHAEHLLRHFAAKFEEKYTYMFALTWNNMTYCKDENGIQNATFQIALVSYKMKTTYVFLLYNHTGNNSCKNDVVVEISNGNPCQTFTHSSNSDVQELVRSKRRTGVTGAYVYRVDRPDNENELNLLLYGEGFRDRCLDGDSDPNACNRQSASSSVVEHLPLNGKYTFYSQQYSDVAVCGNGVIRFGGDTTSCNSNLTTSTTPIVVGFGQSITFDESVATYRERYLYTNATMYERDYFMTNKY